MVKRFTTASLCWGLEGAQRLPDAFGAVAAADGISERQIGLRQAQANWLE